MNKPHIRSNLRTAQPRHNPPHESPAHAERGGTTNSFGNLQQRTGRLSTDESSVFREECMRIKQELVDMAKQSQELASWPGPRQWRQGGFGLGPELVGWA